MVRWEASNADRRAYCAYCYVPRGRRVRNTHVLKWTRGGRLTGWFEGITIQAGTRRFACGPCAWRVQAREAGRGNVVGVYRYRPTPTPAAGV